MSTLFKNEDDAVEAARVGDPTKPFCKGGCGGRVKSLKGIAGWCTENGCRDKEIQKRKDAGTWGVSRNGSHMKDKAAIAAKKIPDPAIATGIAFGSPRSDFESAAAEYVSAKANVEEAKKALENAAHALEVARTALHQVLDADTN